MALQRSDDSSGARADSVAASGIDTPFRVGDAVTFSGFSTPEDNGTYIIRAIAGAVLVFDPDTFSAVGAVEHITVTRRMPLALHACTYANRIWACAQDTVWCTKLGDPLSWYWYEAGRQRQRSPRAARSVDVGTPGNSFRLRSDGQRRGVSQAGRALAAALRHEAGTTSSSSPGGARHGEKLRPLARDGGGDALLPLPRRAGAHLRRTAGARRRRARAHAHGRCGGHGRHALVSLGARSAKRLAPVRIRHAQRPVGAARTHFTHPGSPGTTARSTRRIRAASGASARAARRSWRACWRRGDFVSGSPDCKRLLRVQLRLEADAGASVTAAVQ
ncbi:MAG: hypothetical protein ACLSHG_00425 [Oscillospiraceae bacterium]